MKFRYTGEAPEGSITMYGATFEQGGIGEVTEPQWIAKLLNHPLFEVIGEGQSETSPVSEPKKRGRPPKPKEPPNGN